MFASHVLHLTGLLALAGGGAGTTIQVDPGVTAIRTCRLSCVSFRTESDGWLFDHCGNVYRTSNGGDGWIHDLAVEALFAKESAQPKPTKNSENDPLYKAFASGAGVSPETLTRMASRGHIGFMHWFSPTEAVAGGDVGASMLRTTDAGKTWTRVATPTGQWVYVVETRGDTIWTCGSSGQIIRSTDRGRTWLSLRSPFNSDDRCVALAIGADRRGQALGMKGSRWTTTDDGATWTADAASPQITAAPASTKAPDGGTGLPTLLDRVRVHPVPAGLPASVGRVHVQPASPPVPRGGGSVRIDGSLLVFDEPGGARRSGPVRSVASGKTVPLLAVERIGPATYGWTTERLFFAEDGRTWYAVGPLPTAPRRITFVNNLAAVLEGRGGTFRSEDRGVHWKPSSQAALDVADADRARAAEGGKKVSSASPFACLDRASEGLLNVDFGVEGCFGGSHSGLSLRISKGVAMLSGTIDHPASKSSQVDGKVLTSTERARLLQGIAAAATRLEEPSECRETTKHDAEVTWHCDSPTPKVEGRLVFTSDACDGPGLSESVGASTRFGGRSGGYARAIGVSAWARQVLNTYGAR